MRSEAGLPAPGLRPLAPGQRGSEGSAMFGLPVGSLLAPVEHPPDGRHLDAVAALGSAKVGMFLEKSAVPPSLHSTGTLVFDLDRRVKAQSEPPAEVGRDGRSVFNAPLKTLGRNMSAWAGPVTFCQGPLARLRVLVAEVMDR